MTKEDNEYFKNSTQCQINDNDYIGNDVKVRHHCHITRKFRGSAHRDCNFNLELNQKSTVVFHNLEIMILILLCKIQAKSNLKYKLYRMDQKNI